jgi:hypothetical protein
MYKETEAIDFVMLPLPLHPPISTLVVTGKMKVKPAFLLDKILKPFIRNIRIS